MTLIDAEAMISSLNALQPSAERSRVDTIAELFPAIQIALSRGVTAKAIMADLQRNGLKLHPARFKELMEAEAMRRDKSGERLHCKTCQAALTLPAPASRNKEGGDAA